MTASIVSVERQPRQSIYLLHQAKREDQLWFKQCNKCPSWAEIKAKVLEGTTKKG